MHPPIFSLCYTSFLSLPPIFFILPLFFYSCPLNFFFWASTTPFNLSNLFFVPRESCPHYVPGCPNILISCYAKKIFFFFFLTFFSTFKGSDTPPSLRLQVEFMVVPFIHQYLGINFMDFIMTLQSHYEVRKSGKSQVIF